MILVTHDISVVAYACERVVVMYAGRIVESGPTDVVLSSPSHPYTMGLYNAFPDLERTGAILIPIDGAPPGCRFAARCPFAEARCRDAAPHLEDMAPGHRAACWRSAEADVLRRRAERVETWMPSSAAGD